MEKEGTKHWRGGTIHVTPEGEIEKVVGLDGIEITGEPEVPERIKKSLIFFDDEERCVYGANGRCYCT